MRHSVDLIGFGDSMDPRRAMPGMAERLAYALACVHDVGSGWWFATFEHLDLEPWAVDADRFELSCGDGRNYVADVHRRVLRTQFHPAHALLHLPHTTTVSPCNHPRHQGWQVATRAAWAGRHAAARLRRSR